MQTNSKISMFHFLVSIATHQQNHQQHQQQQQTQQQTEHREYKYQTQHHYNQQPGQQFGTGSQQNVNMIEGMPPQNIPIQHQQGKELSFFV